MVNFPAAASRWFHFAYQGNEHYNSVRTRGTDDEREPGGPIALDRRSGRGEWMGWDGEGGGGGGGGGGREPSAAAVAETVARSGGRGKKSRAREILRLFGGGDVDSAAIALREEVNYRGVLRSGEEDDDDDATAKEVRSIHWSPYDRVREVNADP